MFLKVLVGVAAVAVIAFISVFAWEHFRVSERLADRQRAEDCASNRESLSSKDPEVVSFSQKLVDACAQDGF